ncbi:MAG: hypothetical protein FRX48_02774 [Lasallia pustulata]|uniref:Karyogamy protein, KAR9 n=1 Tax=Lasallia pustulata TaxID=136370 RepID=A0A5M8PVD5_9LECA|nr:MAG: hypothetical protein FRX48_02774 [Lasallia pustulata]
MAAEVSSVSVGLTDIDGYGHDQAPEEMCMNHTTTEDDQRTSSDEDEPPTPPPKDEPKPKAEGSKDNGFFFNPMGLSRTKSTALIPRASFSIQLSQLVALKVPDAALLSSSISSTPTAPAVADALSGPAEQIQNWIQSASEVLAGLDADDDAQWAAAGGRHGVVVIDGVLKRSADLISVYVAAIESLQERQDISDLPAERLTAVADQMEITLKKWSTVKKLLKGVKRQVEIAMEWEELWGVVLGDIEVEIESLSRMINEMEEQRQRALAADDSNESCPGLDIQELETIVEETPMEARNASTNRFSLLPAFTASPPSQSSGMENAQDHSRLLALFGRMQPLRASLDFLPMTLSMFQSKAESVLPTACEDLESRRSGLEMRWKKLQREAESLRQELAEDRWVLVFRNTGRRAYKLCGSLEHSISKLQDAIDTGAQHSNQPLLATKVETYEAKKVWFGSSIQEMLAIIDNGLNDRLPGNGEVLRLRSEVQAKWMTLQAEMRDMDLALDDLNLSPSQQLRDSISSMVSNEQSAFGSVNETPASSPASSVAVGPSRGMKRQPSTPGLNAASRRSSVMSSTTSRPSNQNRYSSLPVASASASQLPRRVSTPRSAASNVSTIQHGMSPYLSPTSYYSATPIRGGQTTQKASSDGKPRWNTRPHVDYFEFKPLSLTDPSPYAKSSLPQRSSLGASTHSSIPLPSPLGRACFSSPATRSAPQYRPPTSPSVASASTVRARLGTSPSPAHSSFGTVNIPKQRLRTQPSVSKLSNSYRPAAPPASHPAPKSPDAVADESPSSRPKPSRPATALASQRRGSMLPIRKPRAASGVDSTAIMKAGGGEEKR